MFSGGIARDDVYEQKVLYKVLESNIHNKSCRTEVFCKN